jgi:glycosyltransferase involved in cell wall biosynthesis
VRPEIIHIFGTEYPHSLEALRSADLNRCVVNIQGLTSILQRHYFAGLPSGLLKRQTLRDFIKRDSITKQKERFERQGASEIEALKTAKHVIGRTTWDLACVKQINPQINYHFCSEILREEFYKHRWDLNNCLRYSVFTSQGSYPVKGLHFLLEAMPIVLRSFPQVRLYVGGYDITRDVKIKDKLRISSYGKYLRGLIKKLGLKENVIFTGVLDEKTMCDRLLKSNVFVSPSTIENESNSLSEAKIMGVPCVASYVGGVTDRIEHGVDGFFYQHDAPYMLAFYICRIFESDALALTLSENAIKSAQTVNNADENLNRLLCIYKQVLHRA